MIELVSHDNFSALDFIWSQLIQKMDKNWQTQGGWLSFPTDQLATVQKNCFQITNWQKKYGNEVIWSDEEFLS